LVAQTMSYIAETTSVLLKGGGRRRASARSRTASVSRTVVLLGLTSMLTDVSAEMVATILPVYVVFALGATPLQFGLLDGIYQGAAALIRIASGVTADRRSRHKPVAAVGYGLSAVCKLGFLAVGGAFAGLAALIFVDRTGKGIRTAPRDAMISLSSPAEERGLAFGVHRAMDTAGAVIGPLIAVGLLLLAPGRYDTVFVVSFGFAVVGFAVLALLVDAPKPPAEQAEAPPAEPAEPAEPAGAATRAAPGRDAVKLRAALALLRGRRFRVLVICGTVLGLVTLSDGFIYLGIQRRLDFAPPLLPLLFVGTALVYMALAIPVGRLADRVGRGRVFVLGYGLLALVYTSLLLPTIGPAQVVVYLAVLGAFYAATDGVLMALASTLLPATLQASGMSLLVGATSIGRLVASILFGALWTLTGFDTAVIVFIVALVAAVAASGVVLLRVRPSPARA
jgi:MFS family permease